MQPGATQEWTPAQVQAAAAEWVWVPDDAQQVQTEDYHLIAYPEWFGYPTQVAWCRSARPPDEVIGEVTDRVRGWGRNRVGWWLTDGGQSETLGARLRAAGAGEVETVDVLAVDIAWPNCGCARIGYPSFCAPSEPP